MNEEEKKRYNSLVSLMKRYEYKRELENRKEIFDAINETSEVSEFEVNEYYSSCSLDEFCAALAIIKVGGNELDRGTAKEIAVKIIETDDLKEQEYLLIKYSDAIEFVYQKTVGFYMIACFKKICLQRK